MHPSRVSISTVPSSATDSTAHVVSVPYVRGDWTTIGTLTSDFGILSNHVTVQSVLNGSTATWNDLYAPVPYNFSGEAEPMPVMQRSYYCSCYRTNCRCGRALYTDSGFTQRIVGTEGRGYKMTSRSSRMRIDRVRIWKANSEKQARELHAQHYPNEKVYLVRRTKPRLQFVPEQANLYRRGVDV